MKATVKQLKDQYKLTPAQFDALRRSVHNNGRGGDAHATIPRTHHQINQLTFGVASTTTRHLIANGYVSNELLHTPDEIDELLNRKEGAMREARILINRYFETDNAAVKEECRLEANGCLNSASYLHRAVTDRRYKLTDKALEVVAELND